jgi:hypothetical protein
LGSRVGYPDFCKLTGTNLIKLCKRRQRGLENKCEGTRISSLCSFLSRGIGSVSKNQFKLKRASSEGLKS